MPQALTATFSTVAAAFSFFNNGDIASSLPLFFCKAEQPAPTAQRITSAPIVFAYAKTLYLPPIGFVL
jgi:hypothetical protein